MGAPDEAGTTIDPLLRRIARVASVPVISTGDVLADTYELGERLGVGGMGVVYRARDHRLGRAVAVKVLKPSTSAADHVNRLFDREARATAQLLHPNIVTLHHVGEHAGCPYLVLELLTGETLAARIARRGRIAISEALAILDGVLAALAFAHEHGVLHRDLKPNNVFVTVDDRVKVLDFGVALELAVDAGPVTRAAGTPGYMAPEQRDGAAQDARTDVWAAALLFVECVTGKRYRDGDAISAIPDVPAAVREQLESALATDPDRRPQTANELRVAFARASAKLAAVDAPRRWLRATLFGVAAVVVGFAAGTIWNARREDRQVDPSPQELAGAWKSNFGTLLLEVGADGVTYGVYEHDGGILAGRYRDGLFVGRWCETPTQRAPDDAGVVQLQFARAASGIVVDGRWAYGDTSDTATSYNAVSTTPWHEGKAGFFGEQLASPAPAALRERFDRRARCP